jgi:flagellar hook protein FlgE
LDRIIMGSFDALTTAVSGLQAQSFALQNISGNIANSQTTAFKSTNTSFLDLMNARTAGLQASGTVGAISAASNNLQGSIQTSAIGTFMAINGDGYFTVAKPSSVSSSGQPVFDGTKLYTRRGDFQPDANGLLVNGAGYYLMGSPVDPATGNPTGGALQVLKFNSGTSMPARATTQIQYSANLPANPLTGQVGTGGSGLLNPADFQANPIAGAPQPAAVIGTSATLRPDAVAVATGSTDLSALPAAGVTGTLSINGTNINVANTDTAAGILAKINAQQGTTGVIASLGASNQLILTSANAATNIDIGGGSTAALLGELGLGAATTNATNLLTQNAVSAGQTLSLQVGANPSLTVTFGTGPGQVQTLAQLNAALGALAGGAASANPANGNLNATAANATDQITVGGGATASVFGIHNPIALPANGTVVGNDASTFVKESLLGGSVTAYDASGTPVDVQLRWAKVASAASGGTNTWNLFYQTNPSATGTQAAWQNTGTNFTFSPSGQMSPQIATLPISNLTVNGDSLGSVTLDFGTAGITQFADPNGAVQVTTLSQNGAQAGTLQTLSISANGQVEGAFSNGKTVDLAGVPLASFEGENFLQQVDGEAYRATTMSGAAQLGAAKIVGSALEASNTDIAGQFTTMIATQQAYSANTKIVTTTDQMLLTLTNLSV